MNGKVAKRIRYAVACMGLRDGPTTVGKNTLFGINRKSAKGSPATRMSTQLKREYKATPFHRRNVHRESHRLVLQVKHGNTTRNFPA